MDRTTQPARRSASSRKRREHGRRASRRTHCRAKAASTLAKCSSSRARVTCCFNVEPEFDTANPAQALGRAEASGNGRRNVAVPDGAPNTPTCCCRSRRSRKRPARSSTPKARCSCSTASCVRSARRARAWKVLRVLGSLLACVGFEYDTAEEVRSAALGDGELSARLSNKTGVAVERGKTAAGGGRQVRAHRRRADLSRRRAGSSRGVAASDRRGACREQRRRCRPRCSTNWV